MNISIKPQEIKVSIRPPTIKAETGIPVVREYVERPAYEGPYEVTPTAEEQIFDTKYKRMTDDVVIRPIPQNYGRIDWNGSALTVS